MSNDTDARLTTRQRHGYVPPPCPVCGGPSAVLWVEAVELDQDPAVVSTRLPWWHRRRLVRFGRHPRPLVFDGTVLDEDADGLGDTLSIRLP